MVLNLLSSTSCQYHAADSLKEYTGVTEATNLNSEDGNSPLPNPDAVLDYIQCR